MRGFVDLHSHYLPAIDDGVKTAEQGLALLRALHQVGFDHVVATPHMRPSMFDNQAPGIREAFAAMEALAVGAEYPKVSLAAEHFFDDVVYGRLMAGQGLPYGNGRAVLIEFAYERLPLAIEARFFDLRRKRLRPVVAHPERYEPFWKKPEKAAESMRRAGGVLLLDVAALVGKYGQKAQRTAEELVEAHAYYAACSDAHRPEDATEVGKGIERLEKMVGTHESARLLTKGPHDILTGNILDDYD
ncbi:MAG: protein tyrosine phosphatase [Myxococcales bacterium]|nr:protein tyrosine phosphatase [Myxococcales bacterium]